MLKVQCPKQGFSLWPRLFLPFRPKKNQKNSKKSKKKIKKIKEEKKKEKIPQKFKIFQRFSVHPVSELRRGGSPESDTAAVGVAGLYFIF